MPRKTKRAKHAVQAAQIGAKRQKIIDQENLDHSIDSVSEAGKQNTSMASCMFVQGPVSQPKSTQATYADVVSGRAKPASCKDTRASVNQNEKQSVLSSVEHNVSSLCNEFTGNCLNTGSGVSDPTTTGYAETLKQSTGSCKEMQYQSNTSGTYLQHREVKTQVIPSQKATKGQNALSQDVQLKPGRKCKPPKVTIPLTNRQVQRNRTRVKTRKMKKHSPTKLWTSTEKFDDTTCENSSLGQIKRTKKVHVKRPPPKKKVKNSKRKCRGNKSIERDQGSDESEKQKQMALYYIRSKTVLQKKLETTEKSDQEFEETEQQKPMAASDTHLEVVRQEKSKSTVKSAEEHPTQCQPCLMTEQHNVHASFHQADARFSESTPQTSCTGINRCTIQDLSNVFGSFHQGDLRFSDARRGTQCTCNALMALCHFSETFTITTSDVDHILEKGDQLHGMTIDYLKTTNRFEMNNLTFDELPRNVEWRDEHYELEFGERFAGMSFQNAFPTDIHHAFHSLKSALENVFPNATSALLTIGDSTVAIAHSGSGRYALFDSHCRSENGLVSDEGSSVVLYFSSLQKLVCQVQKLSCSLSQNAQPFDMQVLSIKRLRPNRCVNCLYDQAQEVDSAGRNLLNRYFEDQMSRNECHQASKGYQSLSELKVARRKKSRNYSKEYMQNLRKDTEFKMREKDRERKQKSIRRTDPAYRTKEQEREREAKSELRKNAEVRDAERLAQSIRRADPAYRTNEQEREREAKSELRTDPAYRTKEQERQREAKSELRKNAEVRDAERVAQSIRRADPAYRTNEQEREREAKSELRKNANHRDAERVAQSIRRADPAYRTNEQEREREAKSELRKNAKVRDAERVAQSMRRADPAYRTNEQEREREAKSKLRTDPAYRTKEQEREREGKNKRRKNPEFRDVEKEADAVRKNNKRKNSDFVEIEKERKRSKLTSQILETIVKKFHDSLAGGCSFVCSCCHQTWFKESVISAKPLKTSGASHIEKCLTGYISVDETEWVCRTCYQSLKNGAIPRFSKANKMGFPKKVPELDLCQLEERLIALRIPFMQLRHLPRGGQLSITGNVVNVPVDIVPTVTALPRTSDECATIPVKLKRKLAFDRSVLTENIRPKRVLEGLQWLMKNSKLYQEANIQLDPSKLACPSLSEISPDDCAIDDSADLHDSDCDRFSEIEENEKTDCLDTMLDESEPSAHEMLSVAPGQGQKPIGLFKDPNVEYLSFPTLFCGQTRPENKDRHKPVHYSDICKWELRAVDRRVAQSVPNILFKTKVLQTKQVTDKATLSMRRCKTKGKKYTAKDILDESRVDSIVHLDEGYRIFRTIRNSPTYFQKRQKDVFAMIRQLGKPCWFASLSAADTRWYDLLRTLGKLIDNRTYSDTELEEMDWDTKTRLVRSDPVTCARHFDHRVHKFIETVLKSECSPLGHIEDLFYRIEFQHRGSPHVHMLLWVPDAPVYGEDEVEDVVEYIDKYISCSFDVEECEKEFVELQRHKHSRTCRKNGKDPVCRFGFPLPPMPRTMILEPLLAEDDKDKENFDKIKQKLNDMGDGTEENFEDFLKNLCLSQDEYINAIRSSLKAAKVYLKRTPSEIRINAYMKPLLSAWKANHDLQFVLDAYACAMYIVTYVSKSQRGMSSLLDKACKEAKKGNKDLKNRVRHIGNKFLNAVEVSAQEACYLALQLPLTRSSREVVFVNTAPPEERTFLLKSKEALKELPEDSEDIGCSNQIERYSKRPKFFEKWTLSDYIAKLNIKYPKEFDENVSTLDNTDDNIYDEDNSDSDDLKCDDTDSKTGNEKLKFTLKNGIVITKRKKSKVIRYIRYSKKFDEENHYREKLLLFYPWRKESQLLGNCQSYKERYRQVRFEVLITEKQYESHADVTDEAEKHAHELGNDDYAEIAPGTEHQEADDAAEGTNAAEEYEFFNPGTCSIHKNYDLGLDLNIAAGNTDVEICSRRIPDDEFYKLVANLNLKQREFFTHVYHWIRTKDEPLFAFLSGGAGVGKSVVIRALYQALHRFLCGKEGDNPEDCRILLCAPTGKAAYNINGVTYHSGLKFQANNSDYRKPSCDVLNTLQCKYRNLSVLIIDEVSMLGNKMLKNINLRLQDIKNNKKPFGNVHVILVGDLFQLKPVKDNWIFLDLQDGPEALGLNLWQELFTMHELEEIMRQKDDLEFAQILNRLREGKHTDQDIAKLKQCERDMATLRNEGVSNFAFPTNELVNAHNTEQYDLCREQKMKVQAQDSVIGDHTNEVRKEILQRLPSKMSDTANLMKELPLAVNCRYQCTLNVDTEDGITNGSCGLVRKLDFRTPSPLPSIVWLEFDSKDIGAMTRRKYSHYFTRDVEESWTPIFAAKRTFTVGRAHTPVSRMQFPLTPASAKTIHKCQGDTLKELAVHMGTRKNDHSHYVAFSRVTNIQGLHILSFNETKISVSDKVTAEMQRLRNDSTMKLCYTPMYLVCEAKLKLVFQNVRSLHLHFNQLLNDHNLQSSDIIAVCETRLKSSEPDNMYQIEGYSIHRNDQRDPANLRRPPHGLATYIKDGFAICDSQHCSFPDFESSFFIAQDHNITVKIVVAYRTPGSSKAAFLHKFREACDEIKATDNFPLLIFGDFNLDISKENATIKEMELASNCKQVVKDPTTVYGTTIDLVFTNCSTIDVWNVTSTYSDHDLLFLSL